MKPDGPAGTGRGSAPRSFAALHHRAYRAYFVTTALAMMADSIEHVISYWIMFQKFHSPALGGFAVLSHWLPFLVFGVHSGALADRFDPRRIIQIGMALFMACSLGWGVLILADALTVERAAFLLVLHGVAGVLWGPASQLLIHDIVGAEHLQSAIRLNAVSRWLGLLAGPAVGGAILVALGPAYGILVNAAIYAPLVLWLRVAPRRHALHVIGQRLRGIGDIVTTVRMIAGNRIIVAMTVLSGGASLIVGNAYQAQMPEFAEVLGHGGGGLYYSLLLAADAAGALAAGLVLEGSGLLPPRPRTAIILVVLWCGAITGFALAPFYLLALFCLLVAGFLELSFNAMAQTLVQLNAPATIRGRVIGLYNMSGLGLRAFSGVTVGIGGSLIGIRWSLAASALVLMAITVLVAWTTAAEPEAAPSGD